jgi:hypothetical protein
MKWERLQQWALPPMDLAALIIGSLALVISIMALPTVFQMFGGAPKLAISFDNAEHESARILRCYISNEPISSRLLKAMKVYRMPTDISVHFSIHESGSGKETGSVLAATIHTDKETGLAVSVTGGTVPPARVNILAHGNEGAFFQKRDGTKVSLSPGKYYVDIGIITSSQMAHGRRHAFVVGDKRLDTFWFGNPNAIDPALRFLDPS